MSVQQKIKELQQAILNEFGEKPIVKVDVNYHDFADKEESKEIISKFSLKYGSKLENRELNSNAAWFNTKFEGVEVTSFYVPQDKED